MQSSTQIVTTDIPTSSFTGQLPFLSPNQQCVRALKLAGNHITLTSLSRVYLGFSALYLTVKVPVYVERIAKPLVDIRTQQEIQPGSLISYTGDVLSPATHPAVSGLIGER